MLARLRTSIGTFGHNSVTSQSSFTNCKSVLKSRASQCYRAHLVWQYGWHEKWAGTLDHKELSFTSSQWTQLRSDEGAKVSENVGGEFGDRGDSTDCGCCAAEGNAYNPDIYIIYFCDLFQSKQTDPRWFGTFYLDCITKNRLRVKYEDGKNWNSDM